MVSDEQINATEADFHDRFSAAVDEIISKQLFLSGMDDDAHRHQILSASYHIAAEVIGLMAEAADSAPARTCVDREAVLTDRIIGIGYSKFMNEITGQGKHPVWRYRESLEAILDALAPSTPEGDVSDE